MTPWTKKSLEIADAPGYLDKLHEIYVMQINPERPLSFEVEKKIRGYFDARDARGLILTLLKNEIFPIKDSYIGFLRRKPLAIEENPITLARVGERLFNLGIERLLIEAIRPKETNRQLGQSFRRWLTTLGHPVLSESEFQRQPGTAFLEGSDKGLKSYATTKLGCTLRKGIDLIFRKENTFIIGEAKFLTTPGGEQDRGFDDAEHFINNQTGSARRIALLDGYIWLQREGGLYKKITESNHEIFSALLLPDYIQSL